jgi:hypothetical protein
LPRTSSTFKRGATVHLPEGAARLHLEREEVIAIAFPCDHLQDRLTVRALEQPRRTHISVGTLWQQDHERRLCQADPAVEPHQRPGEISPEA